MGSASRSRIGPARRQRSWLLVLLCVVSAVLTFATPANADSVTGGVSPVIGVTDTYCASNHVACDTYRTQVSLYAWQQNTLHADFTVYYLQSHKIIATSSTSCSNTTACTMTGPSGYVLYHGNDLCVSVVAYEYTGPYEHSASNYTCAGAGTAIVGR